MITVQGVSSVVDRTVFTDRGPIVKRPVPVLTGSNLRVLSGTDVSVPTAGFTDADVGNVMAVSGSSFQRNDGEFRISHVLSSTTLRLENASFDWSDVAQTTAAVVSLANELKRRYGGHRTQKVDEDGDGTLDRVHGTDDVVNVVIASDASDLPTAVLLLNDLRAKFSSHVSDVAGVPPVHKEIDAQNIVEAPAADNLPSALNLVNDLRRKFESHRQKRDVHLVSDSVNRTTIAAARAVTGVFPGPLTGPFLWTLKDPRLGTVADDPTDVEVRVNGLPASVEAVFGLLGAVVLELKPGPSDSVEVDYSYLNNPPARLLRLNSPEFNLNQWGNGGIAGLPKHRYRSRSFIMDPGASPDLMSPAQPKRTGWKYKGLERANTAVLNDPTTLLLNVPTNRVSYPVLFRQVSEVTLRYDPTSFPQNSTDPWTLDGEGFLSLAPGGNELTVVDQDVRTGPDSMPPFFHHELDLRAPSVVSAAFRTLVAEDATLKLDGVFTGVAFGISDGVKAAVVGFLITDVTNLTSAMSTANSLKARFDSHLNHPGSHNPDDVGEIVRVVDATSLRSLIILLNELKARYSDHIAKGGPGNIHAVADAVNTVLSLDAFDLDSAIVLANELRDKFNLHRTQSGVHVISDVDNIVTLVKQIGLLTNRDFPEFPGAWESFAVDWTEFVTYRLFMARDGIPKLFRSGDVEPSAEVPRAGLPALSDLDGKFDPVQQAFFGPIGRDSTSTSRWQFIRVNVAPIDGNQIENNKAVDYDGSVLPELDALAPWITVGHGGHERILSPDVLLLDSTASTPVENLDAYGMTSGNFRGFIRIEPILDINTAAIAEFRFSSDYYTSGLSNQSMAVVMDDGDLTVQLAFLQFSPSPATVTGTASEPFLIVMNDALLLRVEFGPIQTVVFLTGDTTAALVAARVNAAVGFALVDVVSGRIRLTSQELGGTSSFEIISGSSLAKLGLSPGPYFGLDSSPEPRVSWFGGNFPDQDDPAWARGGDQEASMLGRTMRVSDLSLGGFLAFNLGDLLVTNQAFNSLVDWKLDFRTRVLSFQPGSPVLASFPYADLLFAGALVSVDEGPSGKNLEAHLAVDLSGSSFINLLSYDSSSDSLKVAAQYAFSWNDGQIHTVNIYTSKAVNSILVLGDGQVLSPTVGPYPTYSGLYQGVAGPAVSFGSGSEPVANADLRSARSVVDWESVAVFRDSKVGDPSAGSRRFIGIYQGGSPDRLSSYVLHQVDWQIPHTYRVVRDPVTAVSVYVDGAPTPVISVAYDLLSLPPAGSSFLKGITGGHSVIGFGAFNPEEISRTRWDFVRYSVGRITLTDRLIPPHQVLNQHNVTASPDHLFTKKLHSHGGFTVYSGGTPTDDFMADANIDSFTILGEDTPPIPMTQDLESRGGMIKVATPASGVPAVDFVNTRGFLTDLEDDLTNVVTAPTASDLGTSVTLANDLKVRYLSHLGRPRVHLANDARNAGLPADASDLVSAISLVNAEKAAFNLHRIATLREVQKVHSMDDLVNVVASPDASDLASLIVLANDVRARYEAHRVQSGVHGSTLFIRLEPPSRTLYEGMKFFKFESGTDGLVAPFSDDETLHMDGLRLQKDVSMTYGAESLPEDQALQDVQALANDLRAKYESHRTLPGIHVTDDLINAVTAPAATDLASALALLTDIKARVNAHLVQSGVHLSNDVRNASFSAVPDDLKMAQALINELKLKFERHRVGLAAHLLSDDVNAVVTNDAPPVADPGWSRVDAGPGSPYANLQVVGARSVLRYGTVGSGPVETVYRRPTGIPDGSPTAVELTVSLRVNAFMSAPTVDTGIYAGLLSSSGPGIAVAIGFDVLDNVPYVKLQDVNANLPVFRTPFNWADGAFHTFRIVKDSTTDMIGLVVVS